MLYDAIGYFTEEKHILSCLSVTCGTAETEYHALRGVADRVGTPVHEGSLYDLASLTKLFTGLLVMRLREEGLLDLSRPVTDYAPQFVHLREITVDQVLGFEVALVTPERIDTQPDREAGLRQLFAMEPRPVTGRAYSDMHAMALKYVIEGAAGERYMDALTRRILHPLGMESTFAHVPESRVGDCICYDGEHRIEGSRWIVREGIAPGTPHDPKAHLLMHEGEDCRKTSGGVGGFANPPTAIVSPGFAGRAGRFRLCRKHSLHVGTAVDGACAGHSDGVLSQKSGFATFLTRKAHLLMQEGDVCGHAGLFSTRADMTRLCQGVLRMDVVSRESLRYMARNRTGRRLPDGSWTQFLGCQCYVKHPDQYYSEIPLYMSDQAIGLSGFTGHHVGIDPETGVFTLFLGNRVMDRLSVLVPEKGRCRADYGLAADGSGQVRWSDGRLLFSSVDYVHQKDAKLHAPIRALLRLPHWRPAGSEWPSCP